MTALVIAIVGLFLAIASLLWQAWVWSASGPKVQVDTTDAVVARSKTDGFAGVAVVARNCGRTDTQITGWGVLCRYEEPASKVWFPYPSDEPESDPIILTIAAQHQATWYARNVDLTRAAAGRQMRVAGYVRLGTGRKVVSKQWLEA
jgi:hypothetical protein